ncbi:pyrroloquinoline quinone biosynthesis protein PqqB [uncultured Paracoccus sp.]|uniref:pyrroloquinoline quinone biosynthesis protein PqqB n=1 Tax=Paracoccus sp. S1E-3 TaxID=2756130 RepID=UPI0015EF7DE5|nr:pyrroloquinoline quinone biosynthesis protein PqqB [uncultured Paracoccus sp.]MBA4492613.1 pyrroloquinoline quinone biosynthesis protein PqqB [Paracoccus sp. S1E-3]
MIARILGAGAGGGLPQWNCGCRNCQDARRGILPQMTQSSVAVSADETTWVVLNASPDIRSQLGATPALAPLGLRGTPISSVVLTNGDIDHIAGLLTLRERTAFEICATADILDILRENGVFRVLSDDLVRYRRIELDAPFSAAGLTFRAFAVPGKVALFKEGETVETSAIGGQTIGLEIHDGAKRLFYVPGCAALPDWLIAELARGDAVLFDGTVWEDDDMRRTGTGEKTGTRMGHLPMSGPEGSIARLAGIPGQKIFIHINNTNPVLQPDSAERAALIAASWRIAQDGMELRP